MNKEGANNIVSDRKPSVRTRAARLIKAVQAAGLQITGVEMSQDGTIRLMTDSANCTPIDRGFEEWQRDRNTKEKRHGGRSSYR